MNALEACYYRTREDEMLFEAATKGLPQRGAEEPYHCGAHNVRAFRFVLQELQAQSIGARIFEIGFNLGHSAAVWNALGVHNYPFHTIDLRNTEKQQIAVNKLQASHACFSVELGVTVATCKPPPFIPTLAFIDGSHEHADVLADIAYCRSLGITRYLFDDWPPHWGPGVQSAVYESGLLPLHVIGSMAYCVVPDVEGYFKPTLTI